MVHFAAELSDQITSAGGEIVVPTPFSIGFFDVLVRRGFGFGDRGLMMESHRHTARRRRRAAGGNHGRELNEPLPGNQVDVKGWRHGIAAIPDTRDLLTRFEQTGVVQGRYQRCVFGEHIQRTAHHRREQVGNIPLVARKQAVVGRPIVGIVACRTDQPGHGVSPQTGELAEPQTPGACPGTVLAEGVPAVRPEGLDLRQQR